jgi:1,4-alpha-glucan branching enzyme
MSLLTPDDLHLFNEGTHSRLYRKLGSHVQEDGAHFALWAPDAEGVSVMGDFNNWDPGANKLKQGGSSGLWAGRVAGVRQGQIYKYRVRSRYGNYLVDKADPFAFFGETPPRTGSVVWDLGYSWSDGGWMAERAGRNFLQAPVSIYEVHLGSWRRVPDEGNRYLTYREVAPMLAEYVSRLGFTHVELMPVMEHPYYGSWGYQTSGYFAPTSRYGTPQDFMYLIDTLHQAGIGVVLDWVPSHFPVDQHALGFFDGTHLYEHSDPSEGFHPDWTSLIFNYGRHEVRSFLLSSASFWLDVYHADALRVDAVASMLYRDYSRKPGEWVPNKHGGRENLEAIEFLRQLNVMVYRDFPGAQTIAEDSTAWPMVSRPVYTGGLGFGLKWDMGWMHDTLEYISLDPLYRKYHHGKLTFRGVYAFHENFVLPLSHDEVVHGKGSLLGRMPGDDQAKMASLRLLYGCMFGLPGKKLLFMGDEFGQWREWDSGSSLDWHLLQWPAHQGIQRWVSDLNSLYSREPPLHELDCDPRGFEWIDANDSDNSILTFIRKGKSTDDIVLVALNFAPVIRTGYKLGVPRGGYWQEVLNSDATEYGGSGSGNLGGVEAAPAMAHGRFFSLRLTIPPLAALVLKSEGVAK